MDNNDIATIEYRLTNIEQTLGKLTNLVTETKLQEKDIQDLFTKQEEILSAINAHDKRLRELELRPVKKNADKWSTVTDTLFKTILTVMIGFFLAKIGLTQ